MLIMTTVTISLPSEIAKKIDIETKSKGFATRSEFIRTLVRNHFVQDRPLLEPYQTRPLAEVKSDLEKTGKYNKKFINSVIKGLKDSTSYEG